MTVCEDANPGAQNAGWGATLPTSRLRKLVSWESVNYASGLGRKDDLLESGQCFDQRCIGMALTPVIKRSQKFSANSG